MVLGKGGKEQLERYITSMGDELGSAFALLSRQVIELHLVWQQYRQLYANTPETVDLLNKTAGLFFKIVQGELWDSVLLGICRLTDPAGNGARKNLTIWSLHELITEPSLKTTVGDQCTTATDVADYARSHRNKRIAHQDHAYATNPEAHALSQVTRESIEDMLSTLRTVLNTVEQHYSRSMTWYEDVVSSRGAGTLVANLKELERLLTKHGEGDRL